MLYRIQQMQQQEYLVMMILCPAILLFDNWSCILYCTNVTDLFPKYEKIVYSIAFFTIPFSCYMVTFHSSSCFCQSLYSSRPPRAFQSESIVSFELIPPLGLQIITNLSRWGSYTAIRSS